jgi:hypothetical protein
VQSVIFSDDEFDYVRFLRLTRIKQSTNIQNQKEKKNCSLFMFWLMFVIVFVIVKEDLSVRVFVQI